jgi:hypothetical protein
MSINVFCSCCFYYLIRMGNFPESNISQKNVAKRIFSGVLTFTPFGVRDKLLIFKSLIFKF